MSQRQESRSPSPRSPSPRGRVLRGRTVQPSPRGVEQIDAQVSVRRRSRRTGETPISSAVRSSLGSPSLSFQQTDVSSGEGYGVIEQEEDLPTVRDSLSAQNAIPRRRPRGSGERAVERKSIRKAMPKPPGLGFAPESIVSGASATSVGQTLGTGLAIWRVWAWLGVALAVLLCRSLGNAELTSIRPPNGV